MYNYYNNLTPSDCIILKNSLALIPELKNVLMPFKSNNITKIAENLGDFSNIVDEINATAARTGKAITIAGVDLNGSSLQAAKLIGQGFAAIDIKGGEAKLSLKEFGNNIGVLTLSTNTKYFIKNEFFY